MTIDKLLYSMAFLSQVGPLDPPGGPAGLQGGVAVLAAPPLVTSLSECSELFL